MGIELWQLLVNDTYDRVRDRLVERGERPLWSRVYERVWEDVEDRTRHSVHDRVDNIVMRRINAK